MSEHPAGVAETLAAASANEKAAMYAALQAVATAFASVRTDENRRALVLALYDLIGLLK